MILLVRSFSALVPVLSFVVVETAFPLPSCHSVLEDSRVHWQSKPGYPQSKKRQYHPSYAKLHYNHCNHSSLRCCHCAYLEMRYWYFTGADIGIVVEGCKQKSITRAAGVIEQRHHALDLIAYAFTPSNLIIFHACALSPCVFLSPFIYLFSIMDIKDVGLSLPQSIYPPSSLWM